MLELGGDYPVSGVNVGATPGIGDQVDRLGRVADEYALSLGWRVDEARELAARGLEPRRRVLGELVDAAMHVRVVVGVRVRHGVDHDARLRRGGGGVQVDEALSRPCLTF